MLPYNTIRVLLWVRLSRGLLYRHWPVLCWIWWGGRRMYLWNYAVQRSRPHFHRTIFVPSYITGDEAVGTAHSADLMLARINLAESVQRKAKRFPHWKLWSAQQLDSQSLFLLPWRLNRFGVEERKWTHAEGAFTRCGKELNMLPKPREVLVLIINCSSGRSYCWR